MLVSMKKYLLIATLLVATAFAGPAGAAEVSDASLHKLLTAAGIQDLVAHFPDVLRARMERKRAVALFSPNRLSDDAFRKLENTTIGAFKPAGILQVIGDAMKKSVSEHDARKMLAWYDSPLGEKIGKAEQNNAARDMSSHALLGDKKRVIFAMKLDKLLHMTDMSMQFEINAATAMDVAYATEKDGHPPADLKAFRQHIAAGMEKKRYQARQSVILSTVYTYRNIDMKDLAQYRAFLASPASLRFNKALMAGMDAGMERAIATMAQSVAALTKQGLE